MVRAATHDDLDKLAQIWYSGWRDAHAHILPEALARLRTLESLCHRLEYGLASTRVVGPVGHPVGFCMIKGDELYQLYVSPEGRGTGAAAALIRDAETHMAALGIRVAWLACAIGNDRAARFYEKSGWERVGTMINEAETEEGPFPVEVWRYERRLAASS